MTQIVQTESLIRSDERAKIKKRIEAIIDEPTLVNIHSETCNKSMYQNPVEWPCDCDVAEFLTVVEND